MNTRLQRIVGLCRKFQVKALYIFGSRSAEIFDVVHDDRLVTRPSPSDLDIGVLTHRTLSMDEKVSLTLGLEELFNVPRVDLLLLQDADPFLAANIIRGERLYAEDPYLADEYELYILRRAGDLAYAERERLARILEER